MKLKLKTKGGLWIPDCLLCGLDMQYNTFMATYMLIFSYTHKSENDWIEGGKIFITKKINAKSQTSARDALEKLEAEGLIVTRKRKTPRHTYTDYRINEQYLIDKGLVDVEEETSEIPEEKPVQKAESEPAFIPNEQEFVCDMNEMNLPEPEPTQPKPEIIHEPVQLYGEYKNVLLTESEYRKLDEQFGKVFTEITLKRFSEYVFNTAKYSTYRNHNEILKKWCGEDKIKAEKSAEKQHHQILSKKLSESDTGNKYSKSIVYDSLSQSAPNEKSEYSDKISFCEVLKKMGSVLANSNAKSENDFQQLDYIARETEKCSIPFDFVGKPHAMKSALKFMFADSYNRKNDVYSEELRCSANGFIQALAELASDNSTIIRRRKVYGLDVVEKINQMFRDDCQMPHVRLQNFMKFYAKKVSETTVHSEKAFMKAIWWEYLDSDIRTAHAFSELYYPAESFDEYNFAKQIHNHNLLSGL
ncbi:MAG: hypothetical protein K2N27_12665 [Ruminococcus sp.]|nr:hypothetical protein [Ruminococcus sp.]